MLLETHILQLILDQVNAHLFRQYKYAGHRGKKAEKFLEGKLLWGAVLCCTAWGILVPQPGFKSELPAEEAWSPNYWTARADP